MYDNFQIQFGRKNFVYSGLKFGVEYTDDYDDKDKPIPFRRRVFPSRLDGKRITGKDVEDLIDSNSLKKLDDDDAVSLCCIDDWDAHSFGSYVWPTLYYSLKDANVKRWLPLYATESTTEDDKKTYSLLGFTWAFKTWILEVFPGRVPAERLIPDEVEAGSGWWLSSRAYFDGCVTERERRPPHLNRENHYEVPSDIYREFQEQRSGMNQMMKQGQNIVEAMKKYMEEQNVDTRSNREPIIADQHYGLKNVRLNVLMKLQEALDEEAILEEQILSLMHRFADRFTDRMVEINNLMVLHDHQPIDYGKYALGCMTGTDMKKCVYLKSVRDELLRSMEEKRQLMTNYRDM
ncbi:hypothetical protein Tco_0761179 [Tanacetum coccineum]